MKVMLITNFTKPLDKYLNFVEIYTKARISTIQLRAKHLSYNSLIALGQEIQAIIKPLSNHLIFH